MGPNGVSIRVLAGYLAGIALGTMSVTLLFLGMRAVMDAPRRRRPDRRGVRDGQARSPRGGGAAVVESLGRALPLLVIGAALIGIWLGATLFASIS